MAIKMVVGLGNPGKKYQNTRHNIGRDMVEGLQSRSLPVSWITTEKFMNESGVEVSEKAKYKNIRPEEILVILDEFQIPLKKVSILKKGSDGGHNGLKSIIEWLGTDQIPRMRIGIGPLPEDVDPAKFVLEPFRSAEKKILAELHSELENAVIMAVTEGLDPAMNKYNGRDLV